MPHSLPTSIDETQTLLSRGSYVADRSLATALFLALKLGRPLFLEGEAGVGKTEIAKVLAETLGRKLVRLQCYEGLDVASAVYEWNYPRQMLEIRMAEASGTTDKTELEHDIFAERFLIRRPLLQALEADPAGPPVLLIDELDRTDEPFEAFLLEVLADFQVTIPEIGTFKAERPPIVIITSNRTREIHDALKRRCFYHWVDYPSAERELEIIRARMPGAEQRLSRQIVAVRAGAAAARPVQAAGRGRDAGLDARALDAGHAGAVAQRHQRHAGHAAQVPGRHRQGAGQRGGQDPERGQHAAGLGGVGRAARAAGRRGGRRPLRPQRDALRPGAAGGRPAGGAGAGARGA